MVEILVPGLILGIPIVDTTLTILRRLLNKKALFDADLSHSYNLIQKKGLNRKGVVVVYYGMGVLLGICGVLVEIGRKSGLSILIAVVVAGVLAVLAIKLGLLTEDPSPKRRRIANINSGE
jgi:UDP-GlcNAc:undecaprenyl-phosphate GlcNAc-1-phosphate transferase